MDTIKDKELPSPFVQDDLAYFQPSSSSSSSSSSSASSSPTSSLSSSLPASLSQQLSHHLKQQQQQQQQQYLSQLPPVPPKKLRKIILEKWSPHEKLKRRVIFQAPPPDPIYIKPRNVIVQWQSPTVTVRQQVRHLGEIRANPIKYATKYNQVLTQAKDMPQFILDIQPPNGAVLASDCAVNPVHELEGDIDALRLIDLEKEGLTEYKTLLLNAAAAATATSQKTTTSSSGLSNVAKSPTQTLTASAIAGSAANVGTTKSPIDEIFRLLYNKETGRIKVNRAARVVLKVNSRLGRKYGEDDVKHFIRALDINGDGTLSLSEFRQAFANLTLL